MIVVKINNVLLKVINKVNHCMNIVKVNIFYLRKIIQYTLDDAIEGKILIVSKKSNLTEKENKNTSASKLRLLSFNPKSIGKNPKRAQIIQAIKKVRT